VLIDFHTHTTASDGALAPLELLARARERGVGMFAVTDHDTIDGFLSLRDRAAQHGEPVRLIPGVELSCRWSGTTVHIVGLGFDSEHAAMREALEYMENARSQRGEQIAERLARRGFPGALEGALGEAGEGQLGRPHFAAWMVQQGHVKDAQQAYGRYLGQGKVGDVKAFWPDLERVVGWIVRAGGVAVVAHPYKYRFTGMKLRRLLVDFVAAGGGAIELLSGYQTPQQTAQIRRYAAEFGLEVSVGSDFHRDTPYSAEPGVSVPALQGLRGVWERWDGAGEVA
tara:strand:- start:638 stop:1489 length:852 start_codon:yes stop_codon:yes gene_type:complete